MSLHRDDDDAHMGCSRSAGDIYRTSFIIIFFFVVVIVVVVWRGSCCSRVVADSRLTSHREAITSSCPRSKCSLC